MSRYHYQHRFSDDLDFFYDGYTYPKENFNLLYREAVNVPACPCLSPNMSFMKYQVFTRNIERSREEIKELRAEIAVEESKSENSQAKAQRSRDFVNPSLAACV